MLESVFRKVCFMFVWEVWLLMEICLEGYLLSACQVVLISIYFIIVEFVWGGSLSRRW